MSDEKQLTKLTVEVESLKTQIQELRQAIEGWGEAYVSHTHLVHGNYTSRPEIK